MEKGYLKQKLRNYKSVKGSATLNPPSEVDALQSSASMSVVDNIGEGPIYGLVDAEGKKVNNINILEALFLDGTAVKPRETEANIQLTGIPVDNIELVARLTTGAIQSGFENISGHLTGFTGFEDKNENLNTTKLNELTNDLEELKTFISSSSSLGRFGFIQYKYSGIYSTGDLIYSRGQTGSDGSSYLTTVFDLDTYLGEQRQGRVIKNADDQSLKIPESLSYSYQIFNDTIGYTSSPGRLDINQGGKVGYKFLTSGFAGGGMLFFDLGNFPEDVAANSGDFIVSNSDASLQTKLDNGAESGYDVFLHDGTNFSLHQSTPNQIEPAIGETNGLQINLGFQSDLDSKYNYSNIDFDFRNGLEFQPVLDGYEEGAQDFDIRKKLYGPLSYGGDAKSGAGSGFLDAREGGEFSNWSTNPPLEHDSYPYTHTIKRIGVKKAVPTIAIEGLSDTIDDGDDAGVQIAERLDLEYTYGFEGGVVGTAGDLLSGGNSIKEIALGTFESSETQQFEGIVTSNYLNTYNSISDLPRNKSLRNLKIDAADVPGLTDALLTEFDLTSGDLIFPGEEWKVPNRFLRVEKLSFETNSTLIARECSLSYVTEIIGEKFTYPFSALGATTFDARNFATQPSREYLIRGREVMIPSNYSPLNPDGSDKRFVDNSNTYGLRDIYEFTESNYAKTTQDISIGTENVEFSLKTQFAPPKSSTKKYFLSTEGDVNEQNGVSVYSFLDSSVSKVGCRVSRSDSDAVDQELNISLQDRVEAGTFIDPAFHGNVYSDQNQNFRRGNVYNPSEYIYDGSTETISASSCANIHIEFDLLIGDSANSEGTKRRNNILWSSGGNERFQITIETNNKMRLQWSRPSASAYSTNPKPFSTRTFSKFEIVKLKVFGNLLDGLKVIDRSDDSTIVEITTADFAPFITEANDNDSVIRIINSMEYAFGINSSNFGFGAMRNLKIVNDTLDEGSQEFNYEDPLTAEFFDIRNQGNTLRNTLTQYFPQDSFLLKLKLIGQKAKFTVEDQNGLLIGSEEGTMTTSRGSLEFTTPSKRLFLGIDGSATSANSLEDNSQIADFKIKKNNQLIHHWDGTILDTIGYGKVLKDRFGGNHLEFNSQSDINTITDSEFEFGKNKAQIYIGEWDGTFKLGWTDNPAWILYDLMINPIYGIGNNIDDREDINIFNLYSIARYCDAVDSEGLFDGVPDSTVGLEPRFSCNLRISEAKNAFETLGNLASVFRGFTYWDGLGLNFAIDKPKEITAIFNNGNVFDGSFNYGDVTSSARFTRVEVNYSDAKDEYTQKVEYVEDEDRIRQYGIITNKLNGIGTTSKSQARRMGKYVLFSNKLETELVQFRAGLEAIFLEPGDIIRIDDELKNFEINYGKILDVSSTTPNPYIDIQNTVNIDSIQTGISGGLYAYNDKKQDELKDLYDIANFDTVYTFGEDSDVYSGVINNGIIDRQTQQRITKFNITGKESRDNSVRLFLDTGFANYNDITGVKAGSFFNVELDNNVNFTYKVVKKSQVEPNIFQIDAMQYVSEKFDLIEDEDFDIEESSYNIGIPSNTINRPSAPTVVSNAFQENNLTYSITGEITAAADSNETSYRVVLYRTNQSGPYLQKEFQRESDDVTSFKMFGLVDGNYTVKVTALRNPESSTTFTSDFTISPLPNIYTHNLIESINLDDESNASYQRISGSGSGNGSTIDRDVIYQFGFADMKGRSYSIERFDQYTLDIYALSGSDYNLVRSGHGLDTFKFTEFKNNEMFGSFQTGFQLKFELKESGTLVDSAFYDTIII